MVQLIASSQLTLTNLNEKAIDRTEISFWHGLSATKYPLGVYDCGNRDHQYGNEFNVTSGKTYTVRVIAKQTKGSLGLRGGIWYTAMTSGNAWDGLANFTLVGEVSEDGLGVYERKFTVESGKTKAKLFIQIEQWLDSSDRTIWRIYDGQVFDENGQPLVTDQNNYGALTSPMATPNGTYIWKRTITYYTDGTSNTIWEYSGVGANGIAGKDGNGIKTTVITYAISSSGTVAPTTGWTSSVPTLVKGQYLWIKTDWTYTDNSSKTGYSVTYISIDGTNGTNGNGIKTTTITYAGSISGTTIPTSGWTSTIPTVEAGSYLWTKTVWTYTDNSSSTGYSVAKMGNDGTITHTAWSWSADGTDRFTTTYPNLNLLDGTSKSAKTATIFQNNNASVIYGNMNKFSEKTVTGSVYLDLTNSPYDVWFQFWTPTGVLYGNTIKAGQKGYSKFSGKVPKLTDNNSNLAFRTSTNVTNTISFDYFEVKLEEGSVATPHMPSSSEVKTSDYPSYIGTYLDNNIESSSDYKRYQWTIFKGQDSNAYTAYSWSSDGTDRFSTTYPNLNLLLGSSAKTKDGFFKNFDKVENDYGEITIKGTDRWAQIDLSDGFSIKPRDYKPNDKYTISMDVMFTSWNFPSGTSIGEFWIGQRYTRNADGTIGSWKHISAIDLPRDPSQMLNQWIRITQTSTIPPYPDPSVIAESIFMARLAGTSEASFTMRVRKPKQEFGSIVTPWTPSESEAQDQWQDAIPMYVGVGEKDSQNPSDYRWQLNSKYVQASSDSGLSNKAGLDDLASVADTANDALVQAQNAVSNEDYTSWLEHDYQTTINNLQDVSAQNQEDINNVDDRTTIVEGFYEGMKVKWNFIDESFTFSEEGMFISNAQSKMAIQVTSDKIVFWDNNVDVAFITGEVLNIQKGVFLESATIGNHLITKFSNESPVTIIRYVGGIT